MIQIHTSAVGPACANGEPSPSFRSSFCDPPSPCYSPSWRWVLSTTAPAGSAGPWDEETIRLTVVESARQISVLFYLTMLAAVAVIGFSVHWMADTGAASTLTKQYRDRRTPSTPPFSSRRGGLLSPAVDRPVDRRRRELVGTITLPGHPHRHGHTESGFLFSAPLSALRWSSLSAMVGSVTSGLWRGPGVYRLIRRLNPDLFAAPTSN